MALVAADCPALAHARDLRIAGGGALLAKLVEGCTGVEVLSYRTAFKALYVG